MYYKWTGFANRVQLMCSELRAHRLTVFSLIFSLLISLSFRPFFSISLPSLFLSPVPQPLPSPSFSGSQLYESSMSESEWASPLEAVNTLSTPAERWHLDVLDSKLLLFHDATRCNYSNIFALYPAAPATVKRRSWWDPGGAETSVSLSLPDLCKDRLTDRSEVKGTVQRETKGAIQTCPKIQ